MKIQSINSTRTELIALQNQEFLENQRAAGKIAALCLSYLENAINKQTTLTSLQLSKQVEEIILDSHATPTFKNYKGFPHVYCTSVNSELVHGFCKDKPFELGDVIKFDLGVTYKESIADTAITVIYGEAKDPNYIKLINATEECLFKAIQSIAIGKQIGVIGNAIYRCAKNYGYQVIDKYGGHGISIDENGKGIAHASPFISNRSDFNEGVRIQEGMSIAIEPLLCFLNNQTKLLDDGWTVITPFSKINAHFEHSLYIHKDHVEVITYRENEKYLKSNKIYFK